jgi:hypothetical protein
LPLGSQHQQNLVSDPSVYLRCGDSFDHYETVTQHTVLPIPPSSGSSELGNALVDMSTPEPQSTTRSSISLPSLPLPFQPSPEHEPSEGVIGLNPVNSEYTKEGQEPLHVGASSILCASSPLHGHGSLPHRPHTCGSFRLVQNPAGFAPLAKVRSCLSIP